MLLYLKSDTYPEFVIEQFTWLSDCAYSNKSFLSGCHELHERNRRNDAHMAVAGDCERNLCMVNVVHPIG